MTVEETIVRELSAAMQAERYLYPRDHTLLHASAIGQCRRQQGYQLMGVEGIPQDSHFLSICDVGHGIHRQIQDRLVKVLGWVTQANIELPVRNEEHGIMGHVDALSESLSLVELTDERGNITGHRFERCAPCEGDCGQRYIVDIKTITSRPYLKQHPETGVLHYAEPSSFEKLMKPKKEHILQTNLYAWMVKEMGLVDEVPRIMLIYIGKDIDSETYGPVEDRLLSVPYKVFVMDADEEQLNAALKRARHIWTRVRAGELPGKDHWHKPESPAWQCQVCSFRRECYKEEGYFAGEPSLISPSSLAIVESYRR